MLEKSKISVVIADDHPMILKGLHDELQANNYNVLGQAANGMQARLRQDLDAAGPGVSPSIWTALAADPATLARLEQTSGPGAWDRLPPPPEHVWSDDFASILPHLRWDM